MKELYMWMGFVPLVVGFIVSFLILPRMRVFSTSGMFFHEKADIEKKKDPSMVEVGGLAMLPILLFALCICLGIPKLIGEDVLSAAKVERSGLRIMQVIAGCAIMFIVGLKNDIHGTSTKVKFLALLATACMFPFSMLQVTDLQGVFGVYELPIWVGALVAVLLVMYITETVALLDDIDGLGAGMATIVAGIFFCMSFTFDFLLGTLVSGALLGITVPYTILKRFSPKWKKTIIGNAGSYTIGYVLSYLTLSLIQQSGKTMPEGMLMVVMGVVMVPMLDILRVIHKRVREGRAMLVPDRNLLQHRFIRMGIRPSFVPLVILILFLFFATMNMIGVMAQYNLTILAVTDLLCWVAIQTLITYLIHRREEKIHRKEWNMEYGREAWEANPPIAVIRRKQQNFGSMGMPKSAVLGSEIDFIPDGMNSVERNTKRLIDLFFSTIMLVLTSPLFLLCYILIKLDDGGPAIYSQERLGRFGRPFRIYKFRSMRLDAEKFGPALSHAGGDDDPRLTKVGKFLRSHHLDELPQLWNVFCGDMAFIGYRPERKFFIDQIMEHDPRYAFLYQIRPGVTSYATLYNGYTDTMEKMLRRLNYDLYYLEHRSFWFDLRTLWLTFVSIIFGKKF